MEETEHTLLLFLFLFLFGKTTEHLVCADDRQFCLKFVSIPRPVLPPFYLSFAPRVAKSMASALRIDSQSPSPLSCLLACLNN